MDSAPLNGRRAEAARNDDLILAAARDLFLTDPSAPMSAVGERAGVGMSALYRRYAGKDDLLRAVAHDALTRLVADLQVALADHGDPWTVYRECLHRIVAGRSPALAHRSAATFTADDEVAELLAQADALFQRLHRRVRRAAVLRSDVSPTDVILLLEMVTMLDVPDGVYAERLRQRYVELILQSLHTTNAERLPGRGATDAHLAARGTV